jgi:hypothetical protein
MRYFICQALKKYILSVDFIKASCYYVLTQQTGDNMKITIYHKPEFQFDGYTIVIERGKGFPAEFWGMGNIGQYYFSGDSRDGYKKGRHLGKKLNFHDCPKSVQNSVIKNLLPID